MIELLVLIVLIISFLGMLVIFARKLPALITLPPETKTSKENLFLRLKSKILRIRPFKDFSFEILLQKILSKVRVISLKVENKTANHLQRMREKSRKEKKLENDNYWEELKKSANKKAKKMIDIKDKDLPR